VQCKPHEFQKYKVVDGKPVLKYARDVVSITGEDWLKARPNLLAYVKRALEGELKVTFRPRMDVARNFKGDLFQYKEASMDLIISYDNTIDLEGADNPLFANNAVIHQFEIPKLLWKNVHGIYGRKFYYRAVISETSLTDIGNQIERMKSVVLNQGDVYVITHGDDQLCLVYNQDPKLYDGRVGHVFIEGDINDNDGSHVDEFYRLDYMTFVTRGEECVSAFAQLANPLFVANPNNIDQYAVLRRRYGMQMCSGSVHTTYGNSKMSMNVGLTLLLSNGEGYDMLARGVGMNVTTLLGGLEDVTFLSKNFYERSGRVQAYTDLASLLRKLGRATGDVFGSSRIPVDIRFDDHNEGVVKGWIHEPSSLLIDTLRRKYIDDRPKYKKIFGRWVRMNPLSNVKIGLKKYEIGEQDIAYVRHYYPDADFDIGISEYLTLIKMVEQANTFGDIIKSRFIDRIMARRYGMTPVVAP